MFVLPSPTTLKNYTLHRTMSSSSSSCHTACSDFPDSLSLSFACAK